VELEVILVELPPLFLLRSQIYSLLREEALIRMIRTHKGHK
jgi:hypothetical protein